MAERKFFTSGKYISFKFITNFSNISPLSPHDLHRAMYLNGPHPSFRHLLSSSAFGIFKREEQWKKFFLGREVPLQFRTTQQGSRLVLTIDRGTLQGHAECIETGMYFLSITSKEKERW
ncbi:MAG: hypothetical protein H0W62_02720 [Chitinophagales bacterium]|nr:hypothetical protein [Chitinophagales bacterium]